MAKSGLIIEAVPEVLDLKHRIIREIVPIAPKDHIFATNTSGLLVKDIAQAHPHPENVIGELK
jgi:3-hydroxyacyl-CoA dehydrogenase